MSVMLGKGIYSLPEAAKLTGLKRTRVHEWFCGRPSKPSQTPVFRSEYQAVGKDRAISFHDLIELFVAGQLRDHGVTLPNLRRVHRKLQTSLKTKHLFCRREILTGQRRVFTLGLDPQGQQEVIEVLTHQRVFPEILLAPKILGVTHLAVLAT